MTEAAPRLLMLHGFLSAGVVWDRLRAELGGGALTIAPDLLGWGEAGWRGEPYGLEEMIEALEPILERGGPTHLLGHSMGGIVALALAKRFPGRFQAVGVAGLPVFRDRPDGESHIHRRGKLHRALLHTDCVSHAGCVAMYQVRWLWRPLIPVFAPRQPREHLFAAFNHTREGHFSSLNRIVFGDLVPGVAAAGGARVAALHGGRDPSAPVERVRALAREHGWDFRVAPTANHQLIVERPRLTARWIRERLLVNPAHAPTP